MLVEQHEGQLQRDLELFPPLPRLSVAPLRGGISAQRCDPRLHRAACRIGRAPPCAGEGQVGQCRCRRIRRRPARVGSGRRGPARGVAGSGRPRSPDRRDRGPHRGPGRGTRPTLAPAARRPRAACRCPAAAARAVRGPGELPARHEGRESRLLPRSARAGRSRRCPGRTARRSSRGPSPSCPPRALPYRPGRPGARESRRSPSRWPVRVPGERSRPPRSDHRRAAPRPGCSSPGAPPAASRRPGPPRSPLAGPPGPIPTRRAPAGRSPG